MISPGPSETNKLYFNQPDIKNPSLKKDHPKPPLYYWPAWTEKNLTNLTNTIETQKVPV